MAEERDEQEAAEVLARLAQFAAQMAALPPDSPVYRQHAAAQHHQAGQQGGVSDLRRAQAAAQQATPVVPTPTPPTPPQRAQAAAQQAIPVVTAEIVTPSQQTGQLDVNSPHARSILEQVRRAAYEATVTPEEEAEELLHEAGMRPLAKLSVPEPTPAERQREGHQRRRQWRQQVEGTPSHQRLEQEGEWDGRDLEAHYERERTRPARPGATTPDLSQLAAMERNAPPAPRDMARETAETSGPRERTFMQRARLMAQEAGFVKPDYVPEPFQTDEWRQQQAPLSQAERWRFGADMAAVGAFSYLGQKTIGGAAQFMSDEGTGRVLGDVQSTAVSGLGNIATGAMAGFQLGGPGGAAVGAVVGAGATIATLPQKILDWSEALVKSREHLAMWSGQLQQVGREAQIRGYMRDIQSAQETAPMADTLNKALQDVLDELRPIRDDVYKLVAAFATVTLKVGPSVLSAWLASRPEIAYSMWFMRKAAGFIDWWMGQQEREGTTVQMWADAWRNHVPTGRVRR